MIGSSGPRLPWPVLPPPSRLKRPLLPSLAQMPQVPLSFATLSRISWRDLAARRCRSPCCCSCGCARSASRCRRRPRRRRRCRCRRCGSRCCARSSLLSDRSETSMPVPLGLARVVVLDPVVARVVERDARTCSSGRRCRGRGSRRAWYSWMPSPFDRWATLSMRSLPSSGDVSRPASREGRSAGLLGPVALDAVAMRRQAGGRPAGRRSDESRRRRRFSSSRLPSTTLSLEPSISTPSPLAPRDLVVLHARVVRALDPDALVAVGGDRVAADQRALRRVGEPDALVVRDDRVVAQRVVVDLALEGRRRLGRGAAGRAPGRARAAGRATMRGLLVLLEREPVEDVARRCRRSARRPSRTP